MLIHSAKRVDLRYLTVSTSILSVSRNLLAEGAIGWGADYILWLDADHIFPPDTLLRLLDHDLPAIGCNYVARNGKKTTAADRREDGTLGFVATRKETADAAPLRPVEYMGLGVCLVSCEAIKALEKPWFDIQTGVSEFEGYGEDAYFFGKLRASGVIPHIDQKLSLEIGHIAERVLML